MFNVSLCIRKVSPAACYLTGRKVYENDICWLFSLILEWTKYLYMTLRRNVTWQAFRVPNQTRRKAYENEIFWLFSLILEWTRYLCMTVRNYTTGRAFHVPYQTDQIAGLVDICWLFSLTLECTKYLCMTVRRNVTWHAFRVPYQTRRKVYENDICWLFSLMLEWTKYLYMTLRRNVTWQAFCVPYQTRRKVYENYIFLTVFFNTGMDYNTCVWHWESMQPDALSVCFIKQTRQQAWSTFAGCFLHFLKRLNTCLFVQCYFVHTESVTGCILSDGRKVILCHSLVVLFTSRTD